MTFRDELIERLEHATQGDEDFNRVLAEVMLGFAMEELSIADVNHIDKVAKRRLREWSKNEKVEDARIRQEIRNIQKVSK